MAAGALALLLTVPAGADTSAVWESYIRHGMEALSREEHTRARTLVDAALDVAREQQWKQTDLRYIRTLECLAKILEKQGRADEATKRRSQALRLRKRLGGPQYAKALELRLAGLAARDPQASLSVYSDLLDHYRSSDAKKYCLVLWRAVALETSLGRHAKAISRCKSALEVLRKGKHVAQANAVEERVAMLHVELRDWRSAKVSLERCLAAQLQARKPDPRAVSRVEALLARAQLELGSLPDAEKRAGAALARAEQSLGLKDDVTMLCLRTVGQVLAQKKQSLRAEALLMTALRHFAARKGDQAAQTRLMLAGLQSRAGRHVAAESAARKALAERSKTFNPSHLAVAEALEVLIKVLRRKGDHAEVKPLQQRAALIRRKPSWIRGGTAKAASRSKG